MEKTQYEYLSEDDQDLLKVAVDIMKNAYAPYSKFAVGSSIRTKSRKIYCGTNLENVSYGLTVCAEVAALSAANTNGDLAPETVAIVGGRVLPNGQVIAGKVVMPCGRCRQLITEAANLTGYDVRIIASNSNFSKILVCTIKELLPYEFSF
jgi:cytidine deaminase